MQMRAFPSSPTPALASLKKQRRQLLSSGAAGLLLAVVLAAACRLSRGWLPGFVGWSPLAANTAYTRGIRSQRARTALAAALQKGDTVMVAGPTGRWPTSQVVVSMLKAKDMNVRPIVPKGMLEVFGDNAQGYIFGGEEPVPSAEGLVIADEEQPEPKVMTAFVRRLKAAGPLKRVALLTRPSRDSSTEGEKALIEACKAAGVAWTVVRTGKLRGGGPRTNSPHALPADVYEWVPDSFFLGPRSMEEELFDMDTRGMEDSDVSGFLNLGVPDTNRVTAAMALVESLFMEDAEGKGIGIESTKDKTFPGNVDWQNIWKTAKST